MISRKTANVIAKIYTRKFTYIDRIYDYGNTATKEVIHSDTFYDYLYELNYDAWFCNLVKSQHYSIRKLQEFLMQIHTGESFAQNTLNWSWEQRKTLGQSYLKNLSRDISIWYRKTTGYEHDKLTELHDEMIRCLEMDGYVFKDDELYQEETDILDSEAEKGLLEKLHSSLSLPDIKQTFEFLKIAEDHYVAGLWSDCISNARKFFEAILEQVASKYAASFGESISFKRPVEVREYLEKKGLVEKKEKETIDKIYGLLSHTGSHPYMAEKDQARLLRQLCLVMIQFVMLRLDGALKKT
ncbi:MAG: hypothetical protein LHV68_08630 [Elusimicrobia bacterium]|nr:hypothetical protein [Candidatus Liberimonas magnetica]